MSAVTTPTALPLLDLHAKPTAVSSTLMLLGGAVGAVSFAVVFWMLFREGHAAFNTSSDVAWGAPIAYYLFFLLASSGLSIIASLDTVFGIRVFYPITKRCIWLAIITMVTGFTLLALELGHPFRMLWAMPVGLQVRSPMWWMGVLYSIDLVLLCIKFYLLHTGNRDTRLAHRLSVGSFVVCILAAGTLGLVFGMMAMRPAWYSPVMPVYFILTGFATAAAFMLFIDSLERGAPARTREAAYLGEVVLPRLFFVALLAVVAMRFGQILTGLWSTFEGMEAHWRAVRHPLFHVEIWLGFVLPLVLMSRVAWRASALNQFFAAVLFMVGIFAARLELLIVGQEVPLFKGYWAGYVEYWPSFTEWMFVPAGFGLFLFLYGAGDWLLRLDEARAPAGHAREAT
jgi:molybdopterin-containing oxidoreductase family membrane subunit